jgi:hypothetical protein
MKKKISKIFQNFYLYYSMASCINIRQEIR